MHLRSREAWRRRGGIGEAAAHFGELFVGIDGAVFHGAVGVDGDAAGDDGEGNLCAGGEIHAWPARVSKSPIRMPDTPNMTGSFRLSVPGPARMTLSSAGGRPVAGWPYFC